MDSVDGDYVLTPASSSSSSPGKKKKSLEDDASLLVLSSLISAPSRPKVQSSGGERPFQTFFLFLWQIEARFSSSSSSSTIINQSVLYGTTTTVNVHFNSQE